MKPTLILQNELPRRVYASNSNTRFAGMPALYTQPDRQSALAAGLEILRKRPLSEAETVLAAIDGDGRIIEERVHLISEMWTALVGRHGAGDLFVSHPGLSLRHLFLFHRAGSDSVLAFDLRSSTGTHLVTGQRVRRAELRLPFALQCEDVWIVAGRGFDTVMPCLITPDVHPDAWLVSIDRHSLDGSLPRPESTQRIVVGGETLEAGFLFGRSERCDAPCNWSSYPSDLSRVHALLFADGPHTYLADAASSGHIRHVRDGEIRLRRVEPGDAYWFGNELRVSFERLR